MLVSGKRETKKEQNTTKQTRGFNFVVSCSTDPGFLCGIFYLLAGAVPVFMIVSTLTCVLFSFPFAILFSVVLRTTFVVEIGDAR